MRVIFLIASLLFLTACGEQIHVKTTLNATQDVSEGDVVFLSNEVVGEIANVSQLDGKTVLDIELSEKGAGLVKRQAAVVINRLKPNLPVEIYNKRNAVEAVQHGQELQGLSSMFQLGAWMVGDSLKIGDGHGDESLLGYVDAFQRYLQGEQFKEDKKVLEQGIEQLGKEAEGMAKVLNQEMEKATEDLAKAAEVVTQLGNELAPVMGELAKSGKAISDELEKFVKNLENQNAEGKEVGASVLTSLLIALERVNSEIEKQSITRSDPEKETNQQRQNDVPPDANTASQASSDNSINQTVEPTEKPVMPSEDADAGVNADSNPQQEPTLQTEQDKENVKQL